MKKSISRKNFLTAGAATLAGLALGCDRYNPANIIVPKGNINDFLNQYTPVVQDLADGGKEPSQFLLETMLSDAQAVSVDYSRNEGPKVKYKGPQLASIGLHGDADSNGSVNIFDVLRVLQDLRTPNPSPASDIDGNGNVNIFDVLEVLQIMNGTYNTNLVKGIHFDNDTEQGVPAELTINGQTFYAGQNGLFSVRMPKGQDFLITARQANGFKRTIELLEGNYAGLNVFSVRDDVPGFVKYIEEANLSDLWLGYRGLKSMLRNLESEFWIGAHNDLDGATASREEQEHVRKMVETEIYPHIKPEFRPRIYMENPDSIETIPLWRYGKICVLPRGGGYGVSWKDENKDGIIDTSRVHLTEGWYHKDFTQSQILEELLSSLISGNDVNNAEETGLHNYGSITSKDQKLINIIQRYDPLETRENILGL